MRAMLAMSLLLILTGCATADFQPYVGSNNLHEGQGGTKLVVDGVDFWANGSPPFKYKIVGVITSQIGQGVGDEALIRDSVASKVKAVGGDAAIQMSDSSSSNGIFQASPTMFLAIGQKTMSFEVIKYIRSGQPTASN